MDDEIKSLMLALKNLKEVKVDIKNSRETWQLIKNGKWQEAGFLDEESAMQFLSDNEYSNL